MRRVASEDEPRRHSSCAAGGTAFAFSSIFRPGQTGTLLALAPRAWPLALQVVMRALSQPAGTRGSAISALYRFAAARVGFRYRFYLRRRPAPL